MNGEYFSDFIENTLHRVLLDRAAATGKEKLLLFSPLLSTSSYSLLSPSVCFFFARAKRCSLESMPLEVIILETSKFVNRLLEFLRDFPLAVRFRIAGNVLGAGTGNG